MIFLVWCFALSISFKVAFSGYLGADALYKDVSDWVVNTLTQGDTCPFVDKLSYHLKEKLSRYVQGQEAGLWIIENAVYQWDMMRKQENAEQPLTIAITGPSGVGKSSTANKLAAELLSKTNRVGNSNHFVPAGLLSLQGGEYSSDSSAATLGGVEEVKRRIRLKIHSHFKQCGSTSSIVIFDEIEKVMPGALDELVKLMEDGAILRYSADTELEQLDNEGSVGDGLSSWGKDSISAMQFWSTANPAAEDVSMSNTIFILVSDIGASEMYPLLLEYGNRKDVPLHLLRNRVKESLDKQWERLHMSKVVSAVVPFLPLEREHIEQIMTAKLASVISVYRFHMWLHVVLQPSLISYMSNSRIIRYTNFSADISIDKVPSKRSKSFVNSGARATNSGPVQDIKSLLFSHMRPWRPDQIVNIELVTPSDMCDGSGACGPHHFPQLIRMQWCTFTTSMVIVQGKGLPQLDTGDCKAEKHVHADKLVTAPLNHRNNTLCRALSHYWTEDGTYPCTELDADGPITNHDIPDVNSLSDEDWSLAFEQVKVTAKHTKGVCQTMYEGAFPPLMGGV